MKLVEQEVAISPVVLLSVVDHFERCNVDRVLGVVLGCKDETGNLVATNSYALPFDESDNEGKWFLDTSYLQKVYGLFKKINSKDYIIGWYHTGLSNVNDKSITVCFKKLALDNDPFMLTVDVISTESNVFPARVFKLDEELNFYNLNCFYFAEEAEDVGVEHLIREVKDDTQGYLIDNLIDIKQSLHLYEESIGNIIKYIDDVMEGKINGNKLIFAQIQECLNDIPSLNEKDTRTTNDVYLSCLIKNFISIQDLIRNKKQNEGIPLQN